MRHFQLGNQHLRFFTVSIVEKFAPSASKGVDQVSIEDRLELARIESFRKFQNIELTIYFFFLKCRS